MKTIWKIIIPLIILAVVILWLSDSSARAYNNFVESLYQQVQGDHRSEFARRQANIVNLEAIEVRTAAVYQGKIGEMAAATDQRISALNIKSNAALRKAKASSEEILGEKAKVETALVEMTIGRDCLIVAARTREKEIFGERAQMKIEHAEAMAAKIMELNVCEKARQDALSRINRRTWISIGPSSTVYMKDGTVYHTLGISIQIPVIEIKSPFKRF